MHIIIYNAYFCFDFRFFFLGLKCWYSVLNGEQTDVLTFMDLWWPGMIHFTGDFSLDVKSVNIWWHQFASLKFNFCHSYCCRCLHIPRQKNLEWSSKFVFSTVLKLWQRKPIFPLNSNHKIKIGLWNGSQLGIWKSFIRKHYRFCRSL